MYIDYAKFSSINNRGSTENSFLTLNLNYTFTSINVKLWCVTECVGTKLYFEYTAGVTSCSCPRLGCFCPLSCWGWVPVVGGTDSRTRCYSDHGRCPPPMPWNLQHTPTQSQTQHLHNSTRLQSDTEV